MCSTFERRQLFRQCGAHHRVAQRTKAADRGGVRAPTAKAATTAIDCDDRKPTGATARKQFIVGERLKKARLFPERAFQQAEIIRRDAFAAAADHLRSAAAQLRDFIDHVRFEGRRELVGDVGDVVMRRTPPTRTASRQR